MERLYDKMCAVPAGALLGAYILCQNNDTTRGNNMRREQRQQEENIKYK